MAYKQPSAGLPFKQLGSSPAKQKPGFDLRGYPTAKSIASGNVKGNIAYGYKTTTPKAVKALKNTPKQLVKGGGEILKTTSRNLISGGKQVLKKGLKLFGGKTLGILGMLQATSSKADQPKNNNKSEGEQIKNLLTKHKLKGGNN